MSDSSIHHTERHRPLIEELREGMMGSYVSMLRRLNGDIVTELERARGLEKGSAFFVIQGGRNDVANFLVPDLVKARAFASSNPQDVRFKDNPDYRFDEIKHRWVRVKPEDKAEPRKKGKPEDEKKPRGKKAEEETEKHKPGKEEPAVEGAWYADEAGNVRFALKPVGKFRRQLSEEEAKALYQNFNVVVTEVMGAKADQLAEFMRVDIDDIESMKEAVGLAQMSGKTVEEVFVENYVAGLEDTDEEGNTLTDEDKIAAAHEAYSDMVEGFKTAVESDEWRKYSQKALGRLRKDAVEAAEIIKRQQPLVKDLFKSLMSGDTRTESMKMLGVMHDLGMLFIPENITEAKHLPGVGTDAEAYKLIGTVHPAVDRFNAVVRFADTLGVEQQTALVMMTLANEVQQQQLEDPVFDTADFWKTAVENPAFNALRRWQENAGKTYTDEEWNQVRERVAEAAKIVSETMQAYNEDPSRAIIFRALAHGKTSLKQLVQNPEELARLQQLQADLEARMARAVAAQDNPDVEIDPIIENALKRGDPNGGLFDFQKTAVGWMQEIEAGILAYGAGVGKTPISVTWISNLIRQGKVKRGICTVPTSLVDQWASEIVRFRPGSKVLTLTGDATDRLLLLQAVNNGDLEADYIIVPDSSLSMLTDESQEELDSLIKDNQRKTKKAVGKVERAKLLAESGILERDPLVSALRNLEGAAVFDEIHMVGLKESSNTKHIVAREMLKNRQYKIGMTATPMTKGPEDLYTLMNLFNPGSAGESLSRFAGRFTKFEKVVDEEGNESMEASMEDLKDLEAAKRTIKPFVYFRSKIEDSIQKEMEAKGKRLPKLNPVSQPVTPPPEAMAEYNSTGEVGYDNNIEPYGGRGDRLTDAQAEANMRERGYSDFAISRGMEARARTRQLMASISPRLVNKDYKGPEPKIEAVVEIVQRHLAVAANADKPIVIFGNYKNALALMQEALVKANMPKHLIATYSGDVGAEDRVAIKNAVNAGKIKVVLVSPAGGTGLNLQRAANRMIFLDKPWTPAQIEQMLGRVWRTGNPNERVHVHHLGLVGTMDDAKYKKNESRISFADALAVADKGEEAISSTVMSSIKNLLGEMHRTVENWTPEQRQEILQHAGLSSSDDLPAFLEIPALRENVDFQAFLDQVERDNFKAFGDVRVSREAALNDARFKAGVITKDQYERAKRKVARTAYNWTQVVDQAQHQYVSRYLTDLDWKSGETGTTVGNRTEGIKTRAKSSSKSKPSPKPEKEPLRLESTRGQLRMTPKSNFRLKGSGKNTFKEGSPEWSFWEVIRRSKPTSYADAVAKVSAGIHDLYLGSDNEMTKKKAKEVTLKYFEKKKILHKFAEQGLIEVM